MANGEVIWLEPVRVMARVQVVYGGDSVPIFRRYSAFDVCGGG